MNKTSFALVAVTVVLELCELMHIPEDEQAETLLEVAKQIHLFTIKANKQHSLICVYNVEGEHIRTHTHFNYQEAKDGHFCTEFD